MLREMMISGTNNCPYGSIKDMLEDNYTMGFSVDPIMVVMDHSHISWRTTTPWDPTTKPSTRRNE